jgi:myo-inositol-1(or 4)-monophosphatase
MPLSDSSETKLWRSSRGDRRNELRLALTAQLARQVLRVRMLGSAAIDLAWLAEGKTDACITLGSHPWDTAAGVIIATEAGAKIVDLDGASHTLQAKATIASAQHLSRTSRG